MTDDRNELVRFIMDERNSHMACVGAAVSFMRANTKFGPRIADAIDETIKREVTAIQAEQLGGKGYDPTQN